MTFIGPCKITSITVDPGTCQETMIPVALVNKKHESITRFLFSPSLGKQELMNHPYTVIDGERLTVVVPDGCVVKGKSRKL